MLPEFFLQLTDRQIEDFFDCTIDADNMSCCIDGRDRPVIAVIIPYLSDETVCRVSTTGGAGEVESKENSPRDEVFDRRFSVERLFDRGIFLDCHDTV